MVNGGGVKYHEKRDNSECDYIANVNSLKPEHHLHST
jgi:hypothetical protein